MTKPVVNPPGGKKQGRNSYSGRVEGKGAATIETSDVRISFGGLEAVAGVSLKLTPGLHCIIGPNGAGKTTFFNLLVGLLRPTKGGIQYNGKDVVRLKIHQRARRGMGIKTQVPNVYGELSVEENVWLGAYALLHNKGKATARAREILQQVGLPPERFDEMAINLSHGEQQLLEIAMVLASGPKLILLDEPSAGMTRAEAKRMVDLVTEVAKSATVVVVEHNMEFIRQLAAPVTVLHQGKVFAQGSLEQLRQDENVINVYLGRRAHATS